MRWYKTPKWTSWIFPDAIWDFPFKPVDYPDEKRIYLSFDDGPDPQVTPIVLDILDQFNAKATFFCLGERVSENTELFSELKRRGHQVGSHGENHLKGWETSLDNYLENVRRTADFFPSRLFRPPYGKLSRAQFKALKEDGWQVVFWSVMAYDFDSRLSPENRIAQLKKNVRSGSIVVMHDTLRCKSFLLEELPELLDFWKKEGYTFEKITS